MTRGTLDSIMAAVITDTIVFIIASSWAGRLAARWREL
jgi:hypothetical protein